MTSAPPVTLFLRTAADRIVIQLQIQRNSERFLAHPTSLSAERGQHACAAYASVASMRSLGVAPGDFVRVSQSVRDAVLQVWPEYGFWARPLPASVSSGAAELFVSSVHAHWTALELEAPATAVQCLRLHALAVWRLVRVQRPVAAPFDLELLRERWLTKCVLERCGSVAVLQRNGVEVALRFECDDPSAPAWGRFGDDTVLEWMTPDAATDFAAPAADLVGDEALWCERVVGAMLHDRSLLERHNLAYDRNTVLITGASGVGKSWLARAVASRVGARVFDCSLVALQRRNFLSPHLVLEAIFTEAVQRQPLPSILLLDDIDELTPALRGVAAEVDDDVGANLSLSLQQIVWRMQRHHAAAKLCLLATAQSTAFGPTARLFAEVIELAPPTPVQRRVVLQQLWPGADSTDDVADRCHGFLMCDLLALCVEARRVAHDSACELSVVVLERARQRFAASVVSSGVGAISVQALTRVGASGVVAGLVEQRAVLDRALSCLAPERRRALQRMGAEAPRGVLLYGAPGCGKTQLARYAASLASGAAGGATWHFAHLDAAELVRSTVGDSERRLAAAFLRARQCAPCVLFIDELEALFGARDEAGSSMRKLISQLLVEFDALTADVAVLVIGATNRPQRIDTSLLRPGRFDHLIYIPPPSAAERADILRLYASRLKVESAEQLDSIVALAHTPASHNLTGADLKQLCNRAALQAAMRGGQSVSQDDFRAALSTMRSSLTMDDINQVAHWGNRLC